MADPTFARLVLKRDMIDKIRRWKGLTTDRALAEAMQFDPGNLSRVLAGKQQPGPKFIAHLCAALDADLVDVFDVIYTAEDEAA